MSSGLRFMSKKEPTRVKFFENNFMTGLELEIEAFLRERPDIRIEKVAYTIQKEPGKEITSTWGNYSCAIFYKDQ